MKRIVIVGGNIAAVTAATTLRARGWDGELTLIAAERHPPYSRVPLSKGVLAGAQAATDAHLPLVEGIDLTLGMAATGLDLEARRVHLDDGEAAAFDGLIIATGARARRLAVGCQSGELVVRTLEDSLQLAERVRSATSAVVVGAGFLGMEIASTLCRQGVAVTVVDLDPPLERLLGSWLGRHVAARAAELGVRFVRTDGGVQLLGDPVAAVGLPDGRLLEGDLVVSAVGDVPNVDWLLPTGLACGDGVIVDAWCQVAPGIAAAGDVVAMRRADGSVVRTPHWSNAVAQGRAAALNLLEPRSARFEPDHYFWTEQFGIDLKIAGRLPLAGSPVVLHGDPANGSALLQWAIDDRPGAAVALNHRIPVARLKAIAAQPAHCTKEE